MKRVFAHVHFVMALPVDEIRETRDVQEVLEACFDATDIVIELRETSERKSGELSEPNRNSKCEATATLREVSERNTLVYEIVDAVKDAQLVYADPAASDVAREKVRTILDRELDKSGRNSFFSQMAETTRQTGMRGFYRPVEESLSKPKSEYPHHVTKIKTEEPNGEI